jgi:3-isopropylmalate dehydrogenase
MTKSPEKAHDKRHHIVFLPGDGVGPEVAGAARRVLEVAADTFGFDFVFSEHLIGGAALDAVGDPLPAATVEACVASQAVFLGAVGGPQWDGGSVRPEQGLIDLRRELDVYANLRPAIGLGVDLLIVRELVGGLYYGARGVRENGTVFDTCEYHPDQVARIARRAFELARGRSGRLLSVDKANVLETSRMWRNVVTEVAKDYPDVELSHGLVDSVAMNLVMSPSSFDTLVMENTFGDILSDVAAGVTGGLGLASSASLGDSGPGVFEPVHGSAPSIAGQGIANPAAMLRSLALFLDHGLGESELARAVETSVAVALDQAPTPDIGGAGTTQDFADAVLSYLTAGVAA